MPTLTVFCGALLVLLGVLGYGYGMRGEHASPTSLIPAAFGVVFIVLGLFAARSESARKHIMHGVVVLALLGFVFPAARVLMKLSSIEMNAAVISQIAMSIICLMLLLAGIRSFAAARLNRAETVIDEEV